MSAPLPPGGGLATTSLDRCKALWAELNKGPDDHLTFAEFEQIYSTWSQSEAPGRTHDVSKQGSRLRVMMAVVVVLLLANNVLHTVALFMVESAMKDTFAAPVDLHPHAHGQAHFTTEHPRFTNSEGHALATVQARYTHDLSHLGQDHAVRNAVKRLTLPITSDDGTQAFRTADVIYHDDLSDGGVVFALSSGEGMRVPSAAQQAGGTLVSVLSRSEMSSYVGTTDAASRRRLLSTHGRKLQAAVSVSVTVEENAATKLKYEVLLVCLNGQNADGSARTAADCADGSAH